MPGVGDAPHDRQQLVDHARRQAERGLVEHQQARRAHHGARHRHHLLLAAAHGAGQLAWRARAGAGSRRRPAPGARARSAAGDQPAAELEVLGHASSAGRAAGLRPPARGRGARRSWRLARAARRRRAAPRRARGIRPASAFSSVVLPAPLGPRITVMPGSTSRSSPRITCEAAVAAPPEPPIAVSRAPAHAGLLHLVAQVGLDHLGIAHHLGRRAVGDLAALVQHHHALDVAQQRGHGVLDPHHREVELVAQAADAPRHRVDLGFGEAGRHLVEQQHARPRAPAPCRSPAGAAARA